LSDGAIDCGDTVTLFRPVIDGFEEIDVQHDDRQWFVQQLGLDARDQFQAVDGFGQVVIGPGLESGHHFPALFSRGQHEHGQFIGGAGFPDMVQHLITRHAGHHDVKQDQVNIVSTR
jgi:hypothetical protein